MATATLRIKSKIFPATKKMREAGIRAKAAIRLYIGDSDNCLVELNSFQIRERRVDKKLFVAPPQESYIDSSGDRKYFQLIRIAPDEDYNQEGGLREEFERTVMAAYKRSIERNRDDRDEEPRRRERRDDDEPHRSKPKDTSWDDDEPVQKSKPKDEDLRSSKDDDEEDWL